MSDNENQQEYEENSHENQQNDQNNEQEQQGSEDNNNQNGQNEQFSDNQQQQDDQENQEGEEAKQSENQNGEEGDDAQQEDSQQGQNSVDDFQEKQAKIDARSVYVANVDYNCKDDDIIEHFKDCGDIKRITILKDKFSHQPKGGAYIEFEDAEAIEDALGLSNSVLKGRQITVSQKRTNLRGFNKSRGLRSRNARRPSGYMAYFPRGPYMYSRARGRGTYRPK
ncbi:hypothetical protein PPERSA_10226 [Pseudocohnilembus persalinus]|uniref:RRM domain-containing protein n=1 Tax=Pseudocohnilembus persalinus TaxID=266149 RepID=A0A0V0QLB8_PSEPJ|nr:hypothetical protein PPERSA_10226 [Pseudocohnilembus persalinus]|eukprot:KRX03145.1 hypothetical protein PPERSA_10226 [Pseudocohnilembus persalinus]